MAEPMDAKGLAKELREQGRALSSPTAGMWPAGDLMLRAADFLDAQKAAATPGAVWGLVCKMLPGALLFAEEAEHLDHARKRAHALLCDFLALPAPPPPGDDKP